MLGACVFVFRVKVEELGVVVGSCWFGLVVSSVVGVGVGSRWCGRVVVSCKCKCVLVSEGGCWQ